MKINNYIAVISAAVFVCYCHSVWWGDVKGPTADMKEKIMPVLSVITREAASLTKDEEQSDIVLSEPTGHTPAHRHRPTRGEEHAILDAYAKGMPIPEIKTKFNVSNTQVARILAKGFDAGAICPTAPKYQLIKNEKRYQPLFSMLECNAAPFLKIERAGNALLVKPYTPEGYCHEQQ